MNEQHVDVSGVRLAVRDSGGDGEPVVFLHHGGGNLMMWEPVLPYLRDDYRCITLDLRGHGRSDAPASGYHIDTMAADLIGVLDRLGVRKAHAVGSSLGAEVGLSLAANHPGRVRSLVCDGAFDSPYGPYSAEPGDPEAAAADVDERLEALRARPEPEYDTAEAFVAASRTMFESWGLWNGALHQETAYNAYLRDDGRYVSAWRKWAKDEYMEHFFASRFEDYYPRVACPILVLPGESEAKDPKTSKAMHALCGLAPSCRIEVVPGAIHPFGWMILPEAMAQAVRTFLAEVIS